MNFNHGVKVGDMVRITGDSVGHEIPIGSQVAAERVEYYGIIYTTYDGILRAVNWRDYEKIPNYLDLIANLSAEVVRLSKRVETLEKYLFTPTSCANIPKQLTRDEIVAKAKADVDSLKRYGYYEVEDEGEPDNPWRCSAEFIVNREKRTVIALLKGNQSGKIRAKGKAKASDGDCYNTTLGQAIALRRALRLEVPDEYLNAPQPTGVKVGDKVQPYLWDGVPMNPFVVAKISVSKGETRLYENKEDEEYTPFEPQYGDKIIDDSARYE